MFLIFPKAFSFYFSYPRLSCHSLGTDAKYYVMKPRVVIIGAGFAGLQLAKSLRKSPVEVVLIDRNNFHTFLPLLYQVASAEVEVSEIATPIRKIVSKQKNVIFLNDEVVGLDEGKKVVLMRSSEVDYDYLVLATGSTSYFFGTPGAEESAFPLKTVTDGLDLRNTILRVFEKAMLLPEDEQEELLQFCIVGGGPTGVEYSGALSELIKGPLRKDFPGLPVDRIKITLIEGGDTLLRQFDPKLGNYALRKLEKKGVSVLTGEVVKEVLPDRVILRSGEVVPSSVTVWTAGIGGTGDIYGLPTDPRGHLVVDENLRVRGSIYAAGDIAKLPGVPQVAPAAVQMGEYLAKLIDREVRGRGSVGAFEYKDLGSMAVIGRYSAVVEVGRMKLKGFIAWWMWIVLHLAKLIGFRNKLFVLLRWGYSYVFFDKSVRYILPWKESIPKTTSSTLESLPKLP